jgi:uncharacterized protein (TIGR03437 family)
MRWNGFLMSIAMAAILTTAAAPCLAVTFGTVVPIGGPASDIALDESRGVLYIANFGANEVDVMSTSDYSLHTPITNVAQPGALALSPDSQYLVIASFGNWAAPASLQNAITVVNLGSGTRQTFATGDAPLGVAFINNGRAFIVTASNFLLLDPVSGALQVVSTLQNLSLTLPVPQATFPSQILQTEVAASADGLSVWGVADTGSSTQLVFRYDVRSNTISAVVATAVPTLLPRVSVTADGSRAMIGYAMFGTNFLNGVVLAQYPDVIAPPQMPGSNATGVNVTGVAIDSRNSILYAQIPEAAQPNGPPFAYVTLPVGEVSTTSLPFLSIMDADNLTVRDRLGIPENMVGRAVVSSNGAFLYAISDSGVMVLPVGSLNNYPRLAASTEDMLFQSNSCNRQPLKQSFKIVDPGGGQTDFAVGFSQAGVTVSPSSGKTPATVQVVVDPAAFTQTGTTAVTLQIFSRSAINFPPAVRLLVNNPNPDERGTIVDVPGHLTDLLADPARNRLYVLRQDKNQLQIYDGSTYMQLASLRTATTPTRMSFTIDRQYLLVGHDNAQVVSIFDLNAMQQVDSILLPFGHYVRSVAESNASLLSVVRNQQALSATGGTSAWIGLPPSGCATAMVDRLDLTTKLGTLLPSLGVWVNCMPAESALAPAPNGSFTLLAEPDGNVKLYSAAKDTFVASRKDYSALQGSYAASAYNLYVVGNNILNNSLVPIGQLDASIGTPSGFAFVNQGGFYNTAVSAASPGVMQNIASVSTQNIGSLQDGSVKPTRVVEAPLMTGKGVSFTRTVSPLAQGTALASLTTSGFTVLAWNYDAAVAPPAISSVVNAADGTQAVAPGGLISIFGQQMSPVNIATQQTPLPTALGQSCVVVNGAPVPLLFVSQQQINAQLPSNVGGNSTLSIRTPGGISGDYYFTVQPSAPSVFRSGSAGLATVVRADGNQLVSANNPIRPNDTVVIFLTGMGATSPKVADGMAAPSSPLAWAVSAPNVTLGGVSLDVQFAGLAPGEVGVYQINATVPGGVAAGTNVPLVISQAGATTSLNVQVTK